MKQKFAVFGFALICVLLLPNFSFATSYNVQFCFQWDADFVDADGGDYWTSGRLLDGYGVESDWLSFWWDLHSLDGWTFGRISDIYDCANAHDWYWDTDVYNLLRDCAFSIVGSTVYWDLRAGQNGVDH
jgi:hypothetical protein